MTWIITLIIANVILYCLVGLIWVTVFDPHESLEYRREIDRIDTDLCRELSQLEIKIKEMETEIKRIKDAAYIR